MPLLLGNFKVNMRGFSLTVSVAFILKCGPEDVRVSCSVRIRLCRMAGRDRVVHLLRQLERAA